MTQKMTADQAKKKLLSFFDETNQAHIEPLIDTIIFKSKTEGIVRGRAEASTMIETLVLGNGDYTDEDVRNVMHALRSDNPQL